MNNQAINAAYSIFTNKGVFALLVGSGISRSSGIPTGWEVTLDLIRKIAVLEKQDPGEHPDEWYKNHFEQEPDYSDILERITNTKSERINVLRSYFEPNAEELEEGKKTPTLAHKQIARLVKDGYIRVIITTNFDRLLENALTAVGVEPTVISNPDHIESTIPLVHSPITIVKINGDYLDTKFLNIKSELEEYDQRMVSYINFIANNYGLITCGWSAKWDIGLVKILKEAKSFRYSNYFTHIAAPDAAYSALASQKNATFVQISNADTFFNELSGTIEALENNELKHPLSLPLAIQQIKKYLSKEEYLISFNDLLKDYTDQFLNWFKAKSLKGVPQVPEMKSVLELYATEIESLATLVALSAYWSKNYHENVILNVLKRLVYDSEKVQMNNYKGWSDIVSFPALVIRYCIGIGAVSRGNFNLVHTLNSIAIKTKYGEEPVIKITEAWDIFEKELMNQILGQNYYTPQSEYLYTLIRPFFNSIISIDSEFQQYFNLYESISAIYYNKKVNPDWFPVGRFAHQEKTMGQKILDSDLKKVPNFIDIDSGLFKSFEDFVKTLDNFQVFLNQRHFRF